MNSLGHGHRHPLGSRDRARASLRKSPQAWPLPQHSPPAGTRGQHHLGCATSRRCPSPCCLPLVSSLLWPPACRWGATLRSLQRSKGKVFQLHAQLTSAARYHPAPPAMGEPCPIPAISSTDLQPRGGMCQCSPLAASALNNQCYRSATPACWGGQLLGGPAGAGGRNQSLSMGSKAGGKR